MNPSEQLSEPALKPVAELVKPTLRAETLTPGDVLKIRSDEPKAYVVRLVWIKPHFIEGQTFPQSRVTGFTLLETSSVTDREVTLEELQQALNNGSVSMYKPFVERIKVGLAPKDFHKNQ